MTNPDDVDWETAQVAQLWCLPQHRQKVMDVDFAKSIVALLRATEKRTEQRVWAEAAFLRMALMENPFRADSENDLTFKEFRCRAQGGGGMKNERR